MKVCRKINLFTKESPTPRKLWITPLPPGRERSQAAGNNPRLGLIPYLWASLIPTYDP